MREYTLIRGAFLDAHPICQVWIKENGWEELSNQLYAHGADFTPMKAGELVARFGAPYSEEIHHKNKRHGSRLNDVTHWLAVCRYNHQRIENNLAWARTEGFSLPI